MRGKPSCPHCRWAWPDEQEPDAPLIRHGHRLYLVAIGLTWRLRWAPSAAEARVGAHRDLNGAKGLVAVRAKVRRARPSDLATIEASA